MHPLVRRASGPDCPRSDQRRCRTARTGPAAGYSLLEVLVALALLGALAPPVIGAATRLRASGDLNRSRESAARLIAEARWTAVRDGSAAVEFQTSPPAARVVSVTGDTVAAADLGPGGVEVRLRGARENSRIRYGPLGVGWASSQTVRFVRAGQERSLVVSSLGRVSRR